jgi:hypothetical protein
MRRDVQNGKECERRRLEGGVLVVHDTQKMHMYAVTAQLGTYIQPWNRNAIGGTEVARRAWSFHVLIPPLPLPSFQCLLLLLNHDVMYENPRAQQ